MSYNTGGSAVKPIQHYLDYVVDTLKLLLDTTPLPKQRPARDLEICAWLGRN